MLRSEATVMLQFCVAVRPFLSVTRIVYRNVPTVDGEPETAPVEVAIERPDGKLPDEML